jgi:TrmH family RNA methyltransferase
VQEALAAGPKVRFAVVSPRLESLVGGHALRKALVDRGVETEEATDVVFDGLADTERPQGVLLVCVEDRPPLSSLRPRGRYLILDGIQDPGNVGTLVRVAAAFDLDGVVVLDGSADPWGAKAVRSAAGMTFRLPVLRARAEEALEVLRLSGLPLLVADAEGRDVGEVRYEEGWALAVGNEGSGLRREILDASAVAVRIPMPGGTESLNAGVAGAILIYALTQEGTVGR